MSAPGLSDRAETGQSVRHHPAALNQMPIGPRSDLAFAKPLDHRQLHANRIPLAGGLHRRHERGLARRAAPALAAASLAAQIRVVQFDQARQRPVPVALHHHLHQFVLQASRRVVGNPQLPVQLHRRHSFLGLGDQIHGLKPHRQRQFGGLENGARRDRSLTMALVALPQLSGIEMATVTVTAVRAFEAVRPAPFEERVEALLFGAVVFEKFVQTEAFLKLNLIALHGDTSLLINNLHAGYYTTEAAYEWW